MVAEIKGADQRGSAAYLPICLSLMKNSKRQFSHDGAHTCIYEPRSVKTGLRCFRPGPTQTRLYSHRRWLEAQNFGFRK